METGKPGLASVPVHISSVAAQAEKRMDIQTPLTAVYMHTVPALTAQPHIQLSATAREPSTLHLAVPPLYSKEMLPFLTLHLAGGLQPQPRPSLAVVAPTTKPKSAGKHVCPHCGRDCMKPSVLEKHLRCHTGERPYPCTTCGVSFKTQSNLYKHRRTQAHARLSSESEQGSLDSMYNSRDTCTSSLSLDEHSEESGSMEKNDTLSTTESSPPVWTTKASCLQTEGSISKEKEPSLPHHNTETKRSEESKEEDHFKQLWMVSRQIPLQRQEATLFSKQWGSSVSRGKSQSHESTDSGFSESSDHYPSPGSVLPDHSMDSLSQSTKEHLEVTAETHTASERELEPKQAARKQEQKMLVEHISKLISQNTAVVEDKQLENVRPRKTVLSKQGSIDLPMPYTYKDSFHFDMRINPTHNISLKKQSKPELYTSVPTQVTSSTEHAPFTRSSSLPFSITLTQPETSSPTSLHHSDYVMDARRTSSGQINPTDLARKPVNQHSSAHRPLVRQTAVDCNHTTDGLFTNSSVEEACTRSLSCSREVGDICGEPNNKKLRRKKTQKFAYNKWYMYGGGTFKKLYDPPNGTSKGRKCLANPQHETVLGLQKRVSVVHKEADPTTSCAPSASLAFRSSVDCKFSGCHLDSSNSSIKAPPRKNVSLSALPLVAPGSLVSPKTEFLRLLNAPNQAASSWPLCRAQDPPDRRKQTTDDKITRLTEVETGPNTATHPASSVYCRVPQHDTNVTLVHTRNNLSHTELKGGLSLPRSLSPNPLAGKTATAASGNVKNTFLPKYQLKLPNTHDASPPAVSKSKETVNPECLAPPSGQTLPAETTGAKNGESHVPSLLMRTCESSNVITLTSAQGQLVLPCTVTSLCQGETSRLSHDSTSNTKVVHSQFATTTTTTSCLQDYSRGFCSTLLQSLKSATSSISVQLSSPATAKSSLTTDNNQISDTTFTAVAHHQPYLSANNPPPHTQPSTASDVTNLRSKEQAGSETPAIPGQMMPLDQSAQNVFHVHTADLQICLQIISDEQLALIAPQIERASSTHLLQIGDTEATTPESSWSKVQRIPAVEVSDEGWDQNQTQENSDRRGSLQILNSDRTAPPVYDQLEKKSADNLSSTSEALAKPTPPLDLLQHPPNRGHVSESQSPAGTSMPTSASLGIMMSGGINPLENVQAPSLNHEQFPVNSRVSQSISMVSPGPQIRPECLRHTSRDACITKSLSPVFIDKFKAPQSSVHCSPQMEPAANRSLNVSQLQSNRVHASDTSSPSNKLWSRQLDEGTGSDRLGQLTSPSSYPQRGKLKEGPAVSSSIQTAEETSPVRRSEQKEQEHEATPFQPEGPDWRPKQSKVEADLGHQTTEEPGSIRVAREDNNQELKADRQVESNYRSTVLLDNTQLQGEETRYQEDSVESPEQHLQSVSPTQAGTSECPPPQQAQHTSYSHTGFVNPTSLEDNQFHPPQQNWDSSFTHNQVQVLCESNPKQHVKAQVKLSETQISLSKMELCLLSFSHQHKNQTQHGHNTAGNITTAMTKQDMFASECPQSTSFSPDFRTLSSMQLSQVSKVSRATSGLTEINQMSNNQNTESPLRPFTFLKLDEKQDIITTTTNDPIGHSNTAGMPDATNKYQSVFMDGSLHGYQAAECLTSGVRPVQVCQDNTEDTSSSDDEGKLIIEL